MWQHLVKADSPFHPAMHERWFGCALIKEAYLNANHKNLIGRFKAVKPDSPIVYVHVWFTCESCVIYISKFIMYMYMYSHPFSKIVGVCGVMSIVSVSPTYSLSWFLSKFYCFRLSITLIQSMKCRRLNVSFATISNVIQNRSSCWK